MKTIEVTGSKREGLGKAANKKVRRAEKVPAIVYGAGEPAVIEVDYLSIQRAIKSPDTYIVDLNIDGATQKTIIRDAQFHPVSDNILHVDFLRISESADIEVELPVKLVGTSKGVLAGGKLLPLARRIKVKGLPNSLPAVIEVDITDLDLGKTIRVSDVKVEGVTITSPAAAGIAYIDIPRSVRTGSN
jgi:large subunit ribosomal protein L25